MMSVSYTHLDVYKRQVCRVWNGRILHGVKVVSILNFSLPRTLNSFVQSAINFNVNSVMMSVQMHTHVGRSRMILPTCFVTAFILFIFKRFNTSYHRNKYHYYFRQYFKSSIRQTSFASSKFCCSFHP